MKYQRMADAVEALMDLPMPRGSYLDVSCGNGEMLDRASEMGFSPVQGTEIVEKLIDGKRVVYAEAHALPFRDESFDIVSLLDVIEHLLPEDGEAACREMLRVARAHILITANNKSSLQPNGDELHITRLPYEKWDELFRAWFAPARVTKLAPRNYISEPWRVDLL